MCRASKAIIVFPFLALLACGSDEERISGNSTSTGNAQASGRILTSSGDPAVGAWVECSPDTIAPWKPHLPAWTSITDSTGSYLCTDLPVGRIGIAANDPATGMSHWHDDTIDSPVSILRSQDTLAPSGRLKVALPPGTKGILYFTGLNRSIPVNGETELEIPNIPANWKGSLLIARTVTDMTVVDSLLSVPPGSFDSAGYTRKSMTIRIPLAGGLSSPLRQLPLLLRLDSSWQGFSTSLPDGSDLRLSTTRGATLPLTIGTWNKASRTAAVWTLLDSLPAPGDSTDVVLHWGIPVPQQQATAAFLPSAGWAAVWPLGDTGSSVLDRLGRFPGTPSALTSISGIIGKASRFNGKSSNVVIPNSATGALALPEGGPYTLSCWARLGSFTSSRHVLGNGRLGSHLGFQASFGDYLNSWFAVDFQASPSRRRYSLSPADTAVWTHIVITTEGDSVRLYINGLPSITSQGFDNSTDPKKIDLFSMGASLDSLGIASRFFHGDLSEVWMHNVIRTPDWIRLVAANQSPSSPKVRLVK